MTRRFPPQVRPRKKDYKLIINPELLSLSVRRARCEFNTKSDCQSILLTKEFELDLNSSALCPLEGLSFEVSSKACTPRPSALTSLLSVVFKQDLVLVMKKGTNIVRPYKLSKFIQILN